MLFCVGAIGVEIKICGCANIGFFLFWDLL